MGCRLTCLGTPEICSFTGQYKMKVHWFIGGERQMKAPQGDHLVGQMEATKDGQQTVASNELTIFEPRHEITNVLHMRKQRRRSASW